MKRAMIILLTCLYLMLIAHSSLAHFGMIIPSDSMIIQGDNREIVLNVSFSHPFEGLGMDMERPVKFSLYTHNRASDLLGLLKGTKIMNHKAWTLGYKINRPGVYIFYMEPDVVPEKEACQDF